MFHVNALPGLENYLFFHLQFFIRSSKRAKTILDFRVGKCFLSWCFHKKGLELFLCFLEPMFEFDIVIVCLALVLLFYFELLCSCYYSSLYQLGFGLFFQTHMLGIWTSLHKMPFQHFGKEQLSNSRTLGPRLSGR